MSMPYGPDPEPGQTWRRRSKPKSEVLVTDVKPLVEVTSITQTDSKGLRMRDAPPLPTSWRVWASQYEWVSG